MLKRALLFLFFISATLVVKAQTADEVYNAYLDFNLARLEGRIEDALSLGEKLLPNAEKLSDKAKVSFYYSIGNLFENDNQSDKALIYYEKVAAAVPEYYVAQRALGYLYLKRADAISSKLNAEKSDFAANQKLAGLYAAAVRKALPHLEKAQACDPTDDTLSLIKSLYKNIKDTNGLNTLNTRLAALSKNCIDLLTDK